MRTLFCLALFLLAAAAAPQPLSASAPACTSRTATATTIEAIQADYPAWRGKCVRVTGIAVGAQLYTDRKALLEPMDMFGENLRRSLFLYTGKPGLPWRNPARVEAVGRVGSCRDEHDAIGAIQAQSPDDIVMVGGYCHTSLQTYIRMPELRILSTAPILRLTEAEVPPGERQLVEAEPDLAGYAEQVVAARKVIDALATGDREAFQFLDWPETGEEGGVPKREARAESGPRFERLSASRALYARLRDAGQDRMRVFIERSWLDSVREHPGERAPLLSCWCKTESCEGRWPVARMDADNVTERSYLCVATNDYVVFRGPLRIQARIETVPGGFAEPVWRRSR
ncbi:hypothetical protein P1X14_07885 [Sphingomonas sp. AOB5]|uniref:hypothetical protein n=1 Tax=Sphingomonas sp. AOB5 TaxID=3034017 RepID=UPI0023F8BE00|nr:hypothetical protein [Sphingomonas sp. AOB5]MDF7775163.1 hypothetical protein [Sphingomonas sp. AOB5]